MSTFNPCVFNEEVFSTDGSCEAECIFIVTESVIEIITESGLNLVTEDSDCPPTPDEGAFANIVRIGFPFEPISEMMAIGSSCTIGG